MENKELLREEWDALETRTFEFLKENKLIRGDEHEDLAGWVIILLLLLLGGTWLDDKKDELL